MEEIETLEEDIEEQTRSQPTGDVDYIQVGVQDAFLARWKWRWIAILWYLQGKEFDT